MSIRLPSSSCKTSTPTRRPSAMYSFRALTGVGSAGPQVRRWDDFLHRMWYANQARPSPKTRKPKTEIMPPAKMTQAHSLCGGAFWVTAALTLLRAPVNANRAAVAAPCTDC